MKNLSLFSTFLICSFACFILGFQFRTPSGNDIYNPTKIEWLVLHINQEHKVDFNEEWGFVMKCFASNDGNTLIIKTGHLPKVNVEFHKFQLESMKRAIATFAKTKGWNDWLKVKEENVLFPSDQHENIKKLADKIK